jgi:hypothetical protein
MYAYCNNNPITLVDSGGSLPAYVVKAIISGVQAAIAELATGGSWFKALEAFVRTAGKDILFGFLDIGGFWAIAYDVGKIFVKAYKANLSFKETAYILGIYFLTNGSFEFTDDVAVNTFTMAVFGIGPELTRTTFEKYFTGELGNEMNNTGHKSSPASVYYFYRTRSERGGSGCSGMMVCIKE